MNQIFLTSLTTTILIAAANACDLCSATMPLVRLENRHGWHAGISEQYTSYETLRLDGRTISDSAGQYLHSSITQLYLGYDFTPAFGVQVNLPFIHRSFRRVEDARIESGTESGIGDLSLLAHWTPVRVQRGDFNFTARLVGGIKLPTGDSGRLREEGEHSHSDDAAVAEPEHEDEPHAHGGELHAEEAHSEEPHAGDTHAEEESDLPPGGVHGHDLALGTGSVDGIFGADIHAQWKRIFFDAGIQVTVRGDGDHDFDYADDIAWHAAVGAIAIQGDDLNVAVEVRVSGESKGEDEFQGRRLDDTSASVVYVGPRVIGTWRDRLAVDIGVEFPVMRENSGTMVAPDYRIRAGVGWQF